MICQQQKKLLRLLLHFVLPGWTFDCSCISNQREISTLPPTPLTSLDDGFGFRPVVTHSFLSHFVNTSLLTAASRSLCVYCSTLRSSLITLLFFPAFLRLSYKCPLTSSPDKGLSRRFRKCIFLSVWLHRLQVEKYSHSYIWDTKRNLISDANDPHPCTQLFIWYFLWDIISNTFSYFNNL